MNTVAFVLGYYIRAFKLPVCSAPYPIRWAARTKLPRGDVKKSAADLSRTPPKGVVADR